MKDYFFKALTFLGFISLVLVSCSQMDYKLEGYTWDAYISRNDGWNSSTDYFITYTFNSDGTFTESHKNLNQGKAISDYKYSWKLHGKLLMISVIGKNNETLKRTMIDIEWLNRTTFMTAEVNAVTKEKTIIYYYAR